MNLEKPFLTDPKQIKAWLDSMCVRGYVINLDGLVDVDDTVRLDGRLGSLTNLPVRFGKVVGSFHCHDNLLVRLNGAPKEVGEGFLCYNNQIVSLEGAPIKVWGFYCDNNRLVSLDGVPKQVNGDFSCSNNQLVSLKGMPNKVGRDFYCNRNQLASLEGVPKVVGRNFYCQHNLLVDFKGMEGVSIGGNLVAIDPVAVGPDNVFVSLDGLPKELYSKAKGLDVQAVLELEKKRATSLSGNGIEELSSEVELG